MDAIRTSKAPLPFTPGYDLVGVVEQTGRGVTEPRQGQAVADLCVIGSYAQYAICPARFLCLFLMASIPPKRCAFRSPI